MDSASSQINVVSHQPSFLPWVGFWNKLSKADVFIAMGGVDFNWRDFQNRVLMGESLLTLSIDNKTKHGPLKDVQLIEGTVNASGVRIEKQFCVKRFKYHSRISFLVEYLKSCTRLDLMGVNLMTQKIVSDILQMYPKVIIDNQIPDPLKGKHTRLVDQVLRNVDYPVYWAGPGAVEGYIDRRNLVFPIMAQKLNQGFYTGSIIQAIVQEPDPIDYINSAATWYPLDKL